MKIKKRLDLENENMQEEESGLFLFPELQQELQQLDRHSVYEPLTPTHFNNCIEVGNLDSSNDLLDVLRMVKDKSKYSNMNFSEMVENPII